MSTNKLYIAKFFPIKKDFENIKLGELIACAGADGDGPISFMKYTGKELGICRAKLFLCSKNIKVGDKFYNEKLQEKYYCTKIGFHMYHGKKILSQNFTTACLKECSYKILGEISSEATWIKDGQEFDETSIQINKEINYDGQVVQEANIYIKCPTCNHFH